MFQPSRLVRVVPLAFGLLLGLALFVAAGTAQAATNSASASNSAGTAMQQRIVQIALSYRGYRYRAGGSNPSTGFDCSGFAWWVYHRAGINFRRGSAASYVHLGTYVSRANLQPGDMIIYANTYKPGPSHVEIYLGSGKTIGADNPQTGVAVNHLNTHYWLSHYYMARRLVRGSKISGQTSPPAPTTEHFPQQNVLTSPLEQRSRMTTRSQA